jgi:lambda family phage portal protein
MKFLGYEIKRQQRPLIHVAGKATPAYPSANITRLNEDFPILNLSADGATRGNLRELRARSQQLEREKGGIAERYLSCVEANVIGPDGIALQMKIKGADGNLDRGASEQIEEAWEAFCDRGEFEVTGEHSSQNFDRLSVRASARDGDVLQLVYRNAPNAAGITFQMLEGQHLDDWHNFTPLPNGNEIRMGVEVDRFRRKLAFWVLSAHPGDFYNYQFDAKRVRIPAYGTEPDAPVHAIHVTKTKRPEETRAVPWITPAMDPINMLAGYEEAELVAARAQACKHVFFERQAFAPDGTPLEYEGFTGGTLTDEMEPGGTTESPIGVHANVYNPTHPNQAFADFTKDFRRKISAALNCAYNTLFTDLEGVNYSSIRAGLLDERDQWKMTQNWYIQNAKQRQFEAWLEVQLLRGAFPGFQMTDFDRIRRSTIWKPRRWAWVDPLNDIQAATAAIEAKLTTRSRVIADQSNEDFEDTIDELAEESVYIMAAGLDPALTEKPAIANPTFPPQNDGSGDTGAAAAPPAKHHHSAAQPRDGGGRFAK